MGGGFRKMLEFKTGQLEGGQVSQSASFSFARITSLFLSSFSFFLSTLPRPTSFDHALGPYRRHTLQR